VFLVLGTVRRGNTADSELIVTEVLGTSGLYVSTFSNCMVICTTKCCCD